MRSIRFSSIRWAVAASAASIMLDCMLPRLASAAPMDARRKRAAELFESGKALFQVGAFGEAMDARRKRAAELFESGKALFQVGAFGEACPKLEDSYRLEPSTGTLLALASCHERQGRIELAWEELTKARALVQREGRKDRIEYVEALLAELEPRVPRAGRDAAGPKPRATSAARPTASTSAAARPATSAAPPAEPIDQGASPVEAHSWRKSEPRTHDGFFLQAGLGPGYTSTANLGDGGLAGSFLLGATPWRGVVVGAGVVVSSGMTMGAPFVSVYPDPHAGLSLQAVAGYTNVSVYDLNASGIGGGAGVGYEWWLGEETSAGVFGRLLIASVEADEVGELTSYAPSLTFTFSYH